MPVVSLAIGAAGAVGIYAVLDETDVTVEPTRVVVQSSPGITAHDEAATAAAIGGSVHQGYPFSGKDEASTAAAISGGTEQSSPGGTSDVPRSTRIGGPH